MEGAQAGLMQTRLGILGACFLHWGTWNARVLIGKLSDRKCAMWILCRGALRTSEHSDWHSVSAHLEVSPGDERGQERDSRGKSHYALWRQTWILGEPLVSYLGRSNWISEGWSRRLEGSRLEKGEVRF